MIVLGRLRDLELSQCWQSAKGSALRPGVGPGLTTDDRPRPGVAGSRARFAHRG